MISPDSSIQAVPVPSSFSRTKPSPPPHTRTEAVLETDRRNDVGRPAEPAVPVDEEVTDRADLDGKDPAGELRRERYLSGAALRLVSGEEEPTAADYPLQAGHEALVPARGHGLRHLQARRHPGELAVRRHDRLSGLEAHLERRKGRSLHLGVHVAPPLAPDPPGRCRALRSGRRSVPHERPARRHPETLGRGDPRLPDER